MKKDAVVIRGVQNGDIDRLITSFCFPWSTIQATTKKWNTYYEEQQSKQRQIFILEKGDELIGYASLLYHSRYPDFIVAGIPEIHDLWILDSWRKKGYATMLIQHIEKKAHEDGYTQIGLAVGLYSDYGPAQRLYCSLGYLPDGKGITYNASTEIPCTAMAGKTYPVDDELLLWLKKDLVKVTD